MSHIAIFRTRFERNWRELAETRMPNGKLRDQFLNVEVCFTLADARRKLHGWRRYYNQHRPQSALANRMPAEFAATCSGGKAGDETALENASRFPLWSAWLLLVERRNQ
jgi:hypothetical protein